MEWVSENWFWLSFALLAAISVLGVIVNKTRVPWDDEILGFIEDACVRLGFLRRKEDGKLGVGVPFFQRGKERKDAYA